MIASVDERAGQLRFAESVKKIIELANAEATRRGSPEVGAGHLLLALAGEEIRPLAGPLLEGLGVAADEVRRSAENSVCVESSQAAGEQSLFQPAAKRVLEHAAAEARCSGAKVVDCEHVLLGLLRDRDGVAARVLESRGLRYEAVKEQVTSRVAPR